jgi:uncharacterized membrane protein
VSVKTIIAICASVANSAVYAIAFSAIFATIAIIYEFIAKFTKYALTSIAIFTVVFAAICANVIAYIRCW